ncbi:MAG TPA: DUF2892 domain-containing protein [Bacteroidia bacterium]|nr:DUF2892 domain-containing protein [Bacteroidia bacterium]
MKNNMGSTDKIIRILIAATFIGLYATDTVSGSMGTVLLILAIVFILTSIISFCPLYAIFGMSTCSVKKKE